jgi:hypothetical protein
MPQLINRVPQGLLGLLDSKASGHNPEELDDSVKATFEVRDLYALNLRGTNSQASTLTGLGVTVGAFSNLVVPQGELWLLYSVTAHLSTPPLGAGATLKLYVGFVPADANRFHSLGTGDSTVTGEDLIAGWDGAYLIQPGDSPQVYVTRLTGGNVGVRLNIQRARFQI